MPTFCIPTSAWPQFRSQSWLLVTRALRGSRGGITVGLHPFVIAKPSKDTILDHTSKMQS